MRLPVTKANCQWYNKILIGNISCSMGLWKYSAIPIQSTRDTQNPWQNCLLKKEKRHVTPKTNNLSGICSKTKREVSTIAWSNRQAYWAAGGVAWATRGPKHRPLFVKRRLPANKRNLALQFCLAWASDFLVLDLYLGFVWLWYVGVKILETWSHNHEPNARQNQQVCLETFLLYIAQRMVDHCDQRFTAVIFVWLGDLQA